MPIEHIDGMDPSDAAATQRVAKVPGPVSAWEIAGVPAAGIFWGAHRLGWLEAIGVYEPNVVDFMTICFCAAAIARAMGPRIPGWIRSSVSFFRSLRKG